MSILDKIVEVKRDEVQKLARKFKQSDLAQFPLYNRPSIDMELFLKMKSDIALIAEVKKASPSKGLLKKNFDHIKIAKTYRKAGADIISVLSDVQFFQGNIVYLSEISDVMDTPLLRKDFIIDELQIHEASAFGAKFILLIAEILDAQQIIDFTQVARAANMDVLLELHSPDEIKKIDTSINRVIGINNRDLNTFDVTLKTTDTIKQLIHDDVAIVSESGIQTHQDVKYLKEVGINGILVGEHFMRSTSLSKTVKEMKEWCR